MKKLWSEETLVITPEKKSEWMTKTEVSGEKPEELEFISPV